MIYFIVNNLFILSSCQTYNDGKSTHKKSFVCQLCDKSYIWKYSLNRRVREECGKPQSGMQVESCLNNTETFSSILTSSTSIGYWKIKRSMQENKEKEA